MSDISGFLEVVGNKAGVIIANPQGISCNGCGFINTSRTQ
jgi:filamentous hemagglutinin